MTLNHKIYYKYVESTYTCENYKQEFSKKIEEFFSNRNITALWCSENSNPTKYILIMIYTEIDSDVLVDAAKDFAKEFDVNFITLVKELSTYYEDNHKYDTKVDEYRLLFERKNMVA